MKQNFLIEFVPKTVNRDIDHVYLSKIYPQKVQYGGCSQLLYDTEQMGGFAQ